MDSKLANKINSAACAVWFFREGIARKVSHEDVRTVQESSSAQIETAIEYIEAENRYSKHTIKCSLATGTIPGVKAYADSLKLA
jgi:hypothetical protein